MKKKKILIIGIAIIILIVISAISLATNKSNSKKPKTSNMPVATIAFSKYEGIDAGEDYVYELFYKDNHSYRYNYKKYQITIEGSKEIEEAKGIINNKKDLEKIFKKHSKLDVNIIYYDDTESTNFSTMNELSKKLF